MRSEELKALVEQSNIPVTFIPSVFDPDLKPHRWWRGVKTWWPDSDEEKDANAY
jgi:hypothetical protein